MEKNADIAAQEVRDHVGLIVNDLPETAEAPVVQKLDTDAAPVLRIAVSAPRSLREVTDVADNQIKKRIESIDGVGQVQIVGGREREIEIWVDPDKMRAFNVTVAEIANAVRLQNMEVPGGRVDEGQRELTVRTMGRIADPAEFNNLVVANRGTYSVKLSDVGYAEDSAEEQRTEERMIEKKRGPSLLDPDRWGKMLRHGVAASMYADMCEKMASTLGAFCCVDLSLVSATT